MDNKDKDWFEYGEQLGDHISDLVDSAINSNNYKRLNESIADTINDAINAMQDSMNAAKGLQKEAQQAVQDGTGWRREGSLYQQRTEVRSGGVRKRTDRLIKGALQMVLGYSAGVLFGSIALIGLLGGPLAGETVFGLIWGGLNAALAYGAFRWGRKGSKARDLERNAQRYLDAMRGRDTITITELAAATGKSAKEVREDLRYMISQSVFAGAAYLDEKGTNFMTSREAYRQYQETMAAYRQRQAEERKASRAAKKAAEASAKEQVATMSREQKEAVRQAAGKDMASYSDETRKILAEGNDFIQHIHEANILIPDEVMTEKLDRLENAVTRIFEQVAADPDSAPDLHRLMSYYLPITRKLVDAYIEMDRQKIQGENITKTQQEIENSLDTINDAFEALLDDFFQDTAWDIETDIATLQTMMARDGLTGQAFKKQEKKSEARAAARKSSGAGAGAGAAAKAPEE